MPPMWDTLPSGNVAQSTTLFTGSRSRGPMNRSFYPPYDPGVQNLTDTRLVRSMMGAEPPSSKTWAFYGLVGLVGLMALGYLMYQDKRGY